MPAHSPVSQQLMSVDRTAPQAELKWLPSFLAVGFFWTMLLNQQRLEWTVNPVYSYGWIVPLLVGYLFWSRWSDRPPTAAGVSSRWFWVGTWVLLASYLPLRAVQEANPDWVKINWLLALSWIGLVMLTLSRVGGVRFAGYFAFPLLFSCTALPWPVWMEEALSQNLMRWNAAVSAEVLTLLGTPSMAQGNLIQVGEHWVNVEEACSGIRSLQTAFMMSLFLGEFHRMDLRRRGILMFASFALAFVVNLLRTIILSGLAKADEIERWHDGIGIAAMLICLVSLWLLAEAIKEKRNSGKKPFGNTGGKAAATELFPTLPPPLSWAGAVAICVWLLTAEGLVSGWYLLHERNLPAPATWTMHWPRQAPGFVQGRFADRMTALLKFNDGNTASWATPDGGSMQMYYLHWQPGRVSKFLSSAHYPTVCLPANGLTLLSESGVWRCPVRGAEVPFSTYLFDEGGRDVYVFHAVVEDRPATGGTRLSYRQVSSSERINSVLHGERNLGQRVLGIALRGASSPSEARAMVAGTLASVVDIATTRSSSIIAAQP